VWNIKYGIEKSIVGSFFSIGLLFILFGTLEMKPFQIMKSFSDIKEGFIPYLAIIFIAISYLLCAAMELLTYSLIYKVGPKIYSYVKKHKRWKKASVFVESVGGDVDFDDFVRFLQNASHDLLSEYHTQRGQNILFRVMGFAMFFNILCISFWLYKIGEKGHIIWTAIVLLGISGLFFYAYKNNREVYRDFRKSAFKIFHM
jgi:hypothetical protein